MKKSLLFLLFLTFVIANLSAQRYVRSSFTTVEIQNDIMYGGNANILTIADPNIGKPTYQALFLDIYQAAEDTVTARPLVIIVPAGNFLPHPINSDVAMGMRQDSADVYLAKQLAKHGYVAAIIDLRLGWNPSAATQTQRATSAVQAGMRQAQDVRTALRFFRKSAMEDNNPYGIDSEKMVAWGNGSGFPAVGFSAFTRDYEADFLTNPAYIIPDANGNPIPMWIEAIHGDIYATNVGLNPNTGDTLSYPNHVGISSDFALAVQMGAAHSDTFSIDATDVPLISFKATSGGTTPWWFGVSSIPNIGPILEQYGVGAIHTRINNVGLNDIMRGNTFIDDISEHQKTVAASLPAFFPEDFPELFPVQGGFGTPWVFWDPSNINNDNGLAQSPNDPVYAKALMDTMLEFYTPRACLALDLGCDLTGIISSTKELLSPQEVGIILSPNPASDQVLFQTKNEFPIQSIYIYDLNGRLVKADSNINASQFRLLRQRLANGIYFAKIKLEQGVIHQKIIFD